MQTANDVEAPPRTTGRTQADRSQAMRTRLLDAATALLKERGLARFRTADVAERAAVSKGALLHHFPTKYQLILAVFARLYVDRGNKYAAGEPSKNLAGTIEDLIYDSHAFFFSESFRVSLNITTSAAQDSELREAVFRVVRQFRNDAEEMWATRLAAYGISQERARDAVWLVNSTMRGLAIRALWELDEPILERIERLLANLVVAHFSAFADAAQEPMR